MIIKVIKPLNTSIGGAGTTYQKGKIRYQSEEIEVAGKTKGESINGNNIWYFDGIDKYYWSGGVEEINKINTKMALSIENDLSKKIQLKNNFSGKGEGITIGIFDSGIDKRYSSLKNALISEDDFLTQSHNSEIINKHGTNVAGIIVGNEEQISGVAINAKIRSYRVIKDDQYTDDRAIIAAINYIVKNNIEIDILNLSLDVDPDSISYVQPLINTLIKKGIIIVTTGGIYKEANEITKIKNIIHIGVFEGNQFEDAKKEGFLKEYNLSFLNNNILTTSFDSNNIKYDFFKNDSAYTAMTTGIIANYLSEINISKEDRNKEIYDFLINNSFDIKQEEQAIQLKMYI